MVLGIDFDNTLACYDKVFHRVALETGLLPLTTRAGPEWTKQQVKDYLCNLGLERDWTRLQGLVYGPEMRLAEPFETALATVRQLVEAGLSLYVVSHKTRYPVIGEAYDLHLAASSWLHAKGFHQAGIDPARVFFEETRELKIRRLAHLGCEAFVDDLPEVFLEPSFPKIRKILLDPHQIHAGHPGAHLWQSCNRWQAIPPCLI